MEEENIESKMISRLLNWKFRQASNLYKKALKKEDSVKCLELLEKLWGDNGWDKETLFGEIIRYLVEFIRLNESWTYEEFYGENA